MSKRVYLAHPMLDPCGEELLRKEVEVVLGADLDAAAREEALAQAHGISGGVGIDAALMDRAKHLEVIGFPGSGYGGPMESPKGPFIGLYLPEKREEITSEICALIGRHGIRRPIVLGLSPTPNLLDNVPSGRFEHVQCETGPIAG